MNQQDREPAERKPAEIPAARRKSHQERRSQQERETAEGPAARRRSQQEEEAAESPTAQRRSQREGVVAEERRQKLYEHKPAERRRSGSKAEPAEVTEVTKAPSEREIAEVTKDTEPSSARRLGLREQKAEERRWAGGRDSATMASQRASQRKSLGAENSSLAPSSLARLFGEDEDVIEVDSPAQSLKRLLEEKTKNHSKNATHGKRIREITKGTSSQTPPAEETASVHLTKFKFWLGFETMDKIAKKQGIEELFTDESIADRITRGIPRKEAEELESVSIFFPRVPQTLYPSERSDGIMGQHLNLTQLPQEIEIDPISKFSMDFHIAIHFQLPNNPLLHNHVKELVKVRLNEKKIPLGTNLIEPISILCMSVKKGGVKGVWAGIIQLHLLNPHIDGIALLTGLRVFILYLEPHSSVGYLGKVCKSYHTIARNNNLSIKITNEPLVGITSHDLFLDVLENSFRRGHNFEIVEVQKGAANNHAYLIAPTPS
jgi:hypothetical protein